MDVEFHQLELRYEHLHVRRPDRERRLLASLAERGQQVPIVVIALQDPPDRYLVIDGYKRVRALQRLGHDTVRATVWDMDETEALVLDRSLRTAEGETALEQGWLLAELHGSLRLSLEDLARRFDRSVSWVSRRLALVGELPESVQEQVRCGKIGAHAAMKYLVPMARAKRYDCERLAQEIAHSQFSTAEVGVLYRAWRNGPPSVRERLLADPKLFLRARREIEDEDPVAVRTAEELIGNLDLIGAMARRTARQWREAAGTMDAAERASTWLCLQQALDDLTRLSDKIEKENGHVESESANGDPGTSSPEGGQSPDCPRAPRLAGSGQEGDPLAIEPAAANHPPREGRALPAGDPRSVHCLPGEPGPGP
jgi:ParB/RepB/Spo0J family partition protein